MAKSLINCEIIRYWSKDLGTAQCGGGKPKGGKNRPPRGGPSPGGGNQISLFHVKLVIILHNYYIKEGTPSPHLPGGEHPDAIEAGPLIQANRNFIH